MILLCEVRTLCRHEIIKNYFVQENNNIIQNDVKCEENCDNCLNEIDNEIELDVSTESKLILQFVYDIHRNINICKLITYLYGIYDKDAVDSRKIMLRSFGTLSNTKQNIIYILIIKLIKLNYLNYEINEDVNENANIIDLLTVNISDTGLTFLRNINENVNIFNVLY